MRGRCRRSPPQWATTAPPPQERLRSDSNSRAASSTEGGSTPSRTTRSKRREKVQTILNLEKEINEYKKDLDERETHEFVEKIARKNYGMVKR